MATAKRTQVKANKALDQAQATLNQIAADLKLIKTRLGIEEPKSTGESPVDPALKARAIRWAEQQEAENLERATREASEKEAGDLDRAAVARKEAAAREAEDKARATREAKEATAKEAEAAKAEPKPPTKPGRR